jgi:hypothetical protein
MYEEGQIMRMLKVGARTMMGAAVLVGALIGGWGSTQEARAAVASRGDPIFWIGPGATPSTTDVKLQIAATVNSTVQHVSYAIHAPQGTAVHSILYTGGTLSGLESYTFVADQRTQQYLLVTTVTTPFTASVTVTAQLVTGGGTSPAPSSSSGQSNQPISTLIRVGSLMSPNASWGS